MGPRLVPVVWESKSVLMAHLESFKPRMIVLGLNAEAPRAYYSFPIALPNGGAEIGIISSGLGTDVAAVLLDGGKRLLVGHDTFVTWIDVHALAVVATQTLGGAFYEFLPLDREDEIVILHELGALRVDAHGVVQWSVDSDIVERSTVDGGEKLILKVANGGRITVSLASGAILH